MPDTKHTDVEITEIVGIGNHAPSVALNRLSDDEKRRLWIHLKQSHPEIAASLTAINTDPTFARLLATFDGEQILALSYFPSDLKAKFKAEL